MMESINTKKTVLRIVLELEQNAKIAIKPIQKTYHRITITRSVIAEHIVKITVTIKRLDHVQILSLTFLLLLLLKQILLFKDH